MLSVYIMEKSLSHIFTLQTTRDTGKQAGGENKWHFRASDTLARDFSARLN